MLIDFHKHCHLHLKNKMKSVENMNVFIQSHELTLDLYKITKIFPDEEKYGLISQMRRASSSICANLLEGSSRINTKEYRQFVGIAKGSAGELKYHLLLSRDLKYISNKEYEKFIIKTNDISKMLNGLIKSLTTNINIK